MKRLCVALAALALSGLVWAAEFEGIAPLGADGIEVARQAAIRDALENASLSAGAEVKSSTVSENNQQADGLRVRGQPVGPYTVRREWEANGFYHVTLDVQPAPPPAAAAAVAPAPVCAGADYRRKAVVARFPVLNPAQVSDLTGLSDELQNDLVHRLDAGGQILAQRTGNEMAFVVQPSQAEPLLNPEWIRELARRYGVQFVIGGVWRDAAFEGEHYAVTYGNDVLPGERKSNLNIPGLRFTQAGFKATPKARYFEMDLFIFDGVSGTQIHRQRISGKAEGNVIADPASKFASVRFFASDYGQLIQTKLNEAIQSINDNVRCIPFSARIVRVEQGKVWLDAGGTSRIAPGDRLQVYRLKPDGQAINAISFSNPAQLGWPEEIAGSLTVREVQPLFSSAQAEGQLRVEVGDYVRFIEQARKK